MFSNMQMFNVQVRYTTRAGTRKVEHVQVRASSGEQAKSIALAPSLKKRGTYDHESEVTLA